MHGHGQEPGSHRLVPPLRRGVRRAGLVLVSRSSRRSQRMTPEQYLELKRTAERLKAEEAHRQGSLDQLLRRLRDEHGCKDAREAEKLLARLDAENAAAGAKADKLYREFMREHGDKLKGGVE